MARKAGVTRDRVIDAAAVIADADGFAAVTLASVAAAVGVKVPSLYAHVDGLDGLRRAVARRTSVLLAERLRAAAQGATEPTAALRAIAGAYRAFARDHPGLYASLLPVPHPDDDPEGAAAAAQPVAVVSAVLADLGIAPDQHVDLIRALRALLHGFVDLELGRGFGLAHPVDASFDAAVELVLGSITARATLRSG